MFTFHCLCALRQENTTIGGNAAPTHTDTQARRKHLVD